MCEERNTGSAIVIHSHLNLFDGRTPKESPFGVKIYFDRTKVVFVDKCMVDLIEDLNKNGLPTIFSCCGHGSKKPYILLFVSGNIEGNKALNIVRYHLGNQNYTITSKDIYWNSFKGYYPIVIRRKNKWEST